jgi:hypothetical protein
MAESARDFLRRRLTVYSNLADPPYDPALNRDRRTSANDRRRCYTYLAKDRRNGIADRRKHGPSIPALVDFLRRKRLRSQS